MANRFFKWATEAIGEEAFTGMIGGLFKLLWNSPVKDKVTDKVFHNFFLSTDVADEQLFNAAFSSEILTDDDRVNLLFKLQALDHGNPNYFRIIVAKYQLVSDKKVEDIEGTAKNLKMIANLSWPSWLSYMEHMGLNKPRPASTVKEVIVENGKAAKDGIKGAAGRVNNWFGNDAAGSINNLSAKLDREANEGFSWDPAVAKCRKVEEREDRRRNRQSRITIF